MPERTSKLPVRGRGIQSFPSIQISMGQAKAFQGIASVMGQIADTVEDDLDKQAQIEARREGLVAGATGVPVLREDEATIRGEAFNASARQSYSNRVDIAAREKLSQLETQFATDPKGFVKASQGYLVGMQTEINQVDPAIGAIFGQTYALRAGSSMARVTTAFSKKENALLMAGIVREASVLEREIGDFAENMVGTDTKTAMIGLQNYEVAHSQYRLALSRVGVDGKRLVSPEQAEEQLIALEDSFVLAIGRQWVDRQADPSAALEAIKDGSAVLPVFVEDESGEVVEKNVSITDQMGEEGLEKLRSYAKSVKTEAHLNSEQTRTMRERQDSLVRASVINSFNATLSTNLARLKTEADMTDPNTAREFLDIAGKEVQSAIETHQGTPESKAKLSIELNQSRTKHALDLSELTSVAKRQDATRIIQTDLQGLNADVSNDPTNLGDAFTLLDEAIKKSGAAFLTREQEDEARAGGRQELTITALNNHLATGDIAGMRTLMAVPGVIEGLTPTLQRQFTDAVQTHDANKRKWIDDANSKIAEAELIKGGGTRRIPLTLTERVKLAGVGAPGEGIKAASGLRKEFTRLSGEFISIRDAFGRIETAAKSLSPAGDLALMFNFMKMLDPSSVVRESEFAQIAATGSFGQRLQAAASRHLSGKRLSADQRRDFVDNADKLMKQQLQTHISLEDQYRGIAERTGFDPENVVVDFAGKLRGGKKENGAVEDEPDFEVDLLGNIVGGQKTDEQLDSEEE